MFEKKRFIKQTKNELWLLSSGFTAKTELVFFITQKSAFYRGAIFNPGERGQVLLKNGTRDFKKTPLHLRDQHVM